MKKLFLYIPAMMLLAVSCEKEAINPSDKGNVKMITEIVSGSRGDDTKATIGNDTPTFAWTAGDKVAVHVSKGSSAKYVVTTGGASAAAASAQFTVEYEDGYSRDAFAVYPSNLVSATAPNYGQSEHTLDISLPGTYTLAQVNGETSPCPMIATNTPGGGWSFKQLCGLLRLTVNSIPASTKRMEIDFDGKKVWGEFSIADPTPGSSSIATTGDDAHDVITITNSGEPFYSGWGDGKIFNIPLPVGTYSNITITTYDALTGGNATLTVSRKFAYSATRTKGVKRTASFPVFSINSSRTSRVIFAPGNLQATTTNLGANWTWHFAAHQYDYIGNATANNQINGNGTVAENGTVDLFQKSTTSYTTYGISNSGDYDKLYKGTFKDWGNIDIDGKGSNYWRTLTISAGDSEWRYLLETRKGGTNNPCYTLARINSDSIKPVNGLIVFPDNFVVGTFAGVTWGTINAASAWTTECTTEGWALLEEAGCVFLPITGRRTNSMGGFDNPGDGYYLGNISKNVTAMNFKTSGVSCSTTMNYTAGAVRLVHVVQ